MSVKTLSNVCPIAGKVQGLSSHIQGLSKVCRAPVQFGGSWTEIGHRNPTFVQILSNKNLTGEEDSDFLQSLDKHWTWTNIGQRS